MVAAATGVVDTVNGAVAAPTGTVTLTGTAADVELLESVTTAPPTGAASIKVTVPVEAVPPVTATGLSCVLT
jgi:hypothetical protein